MSYPVIVLGAGASYDYVHDVAHENRPPLTNELFERRYGHLLDSFPVVKNLVATVTSDIRSGQRSLEEALLAIQVRSGSNPERLSQLRALEFYLQKLFQEISDKYRGQAWSNYRALIHEIKDGPQNACIVSFNYDTLLEDVMNGAITDDLKSYVQGPIKIIKVHGSCDWMYGFDEQTQISRKVFKDSSPYEFIITDPQYPERHARNFGERSIYRLREYQRNTPGGNNFWYYPAIAIPLPGKSSFVCPHGHLAELERALQQAEKILVIGWRAAEQQLLELIGENVKKPLPLTVVAGSREDIQTVRSAFSQIRGSSFPTAAEKIGFSNFMGSTECKTFFGTG